MAVERTKYGFDVRMPLANVSVENTATFRKGTPRETHVLTLTSTPHARRKPKSYTVYITAAGHVRVFEHTPGKPWKELVPEGKPCRKHAGKSTSSK